MLSAIPGINWRDIVLLVCASILLLLFITYVFIYRFHMWNITREIKLKTKYNNFTKDWVIDQFSYLEQLSKNNDQLEGLVTSLLVSRKFYLDQLEKLKKKIMTLTTSNKNFKFLSSRKMIKEIKEDIYKCGELYLSIKQIYVSTIQYNESTGNLISTYCDLFSYTNSFFKANLAKIYNDQAFFNIIDDISNILSSINEYATKIDNPKILKAFADLREKNIMFFKFVKTIYADHKAYFHLVRLNNDLKVLLKEKSVLLEQQEKTNLQKINSNVTFQLEETARLLKSLDVDQVHRLLVVIVNQLEPALSVFEQNEHINMLMKNSLGFLNNQNKLLDSKFTRLQSDFESIKDYFNTDKTIDYEKKFSYFIKFFNKIFLHIEQLEKQYKSSSFSDKITLINEIVNVYDDFSKWTLEFSDFCNSIEKKYESSISLIDEIYSSAWVLNQLSMIKRNINNVSDCFQTRINANIIQINTVLELIGSNFIANCSVVLDSIENLKSDIAVIVGSINSDIIMKNYSKQLIFFANKFRHESIEIEKIIEASTDLYKQHQYINSIDTLIPTIQHIKLSAEKNKIKFN